MDEGNGMGQPHDALFKRSFQKPENAVGLLRALVPEGMEGIWDYIPRYRYVLYELARHGYEALPGTAVRKLTLRVLKAQRLSDWLSEMVWDEGLMREALADLESLILYIYRLSALDSVQLEEKLSKLKDSEVRKKAMTLAEKLMKEGEEKGWQRGRQEGWQRGRQEGEQEGWQRGRQEGEVEGWQRGRQEGELVAARGALRVLLEKRFGELGEAEEMRLEAADLERLKEWTGAVLDVESLEALFGE